MAAFDTGSHGRGHPQRIMSLAEVVIREIERHRSLKVLKLFAESVREAGEPSAVHPQRVVLLLNVAGRDPINVGHSSHYHANFQRICIEIRFVKKWFLDVFSGWIGGCG
jgi:hypothetical protein